VSVKHLAPRKALATLSAGPTLEDGKMFPPNLTHLRRSPRATTFHLVIHEGRNRIIRRACAAVGLTLISLKRLRVGSVTIGDLPEGCTRKLTAEEVRILKSHAG
jgi:23S rRNA pseudouridine2605 synthase